MFLEKDWYHDLNKLRTFWFFTVYSWLWAQSYTSTFVIIEMWHNLDTNDIAYGTIIAGFFSIATTLVVRNPKYRQKYFSHTWLLVFTGILLDCTTEYMVLVNPFVKYICDVVAMATFWSIFSVLIIERKNCIFVKAEDRIDFDILRSMFENGSMILGSAMAIVCPLKIVTAVYGSILISTVSYLLIGMRFMYCDAYAKHHRITYPSWIGTKNDFRSDIKKET